MDDAARVDAATRQREGWTIFHHDFRRDLTRRDLTMGEAIRHLLRVTGSRMFFRRCEVRGMYCEIKRLPTSSYSYDSGMSYQLLHFSDLEDVAEAKRVLVFDLLLCGIDLYRGLTNAVFDEQCELIRSLLRAPPSVPAEDWLKALEKVHPKTRPLLRTHSEDLRQNLLNEKVTGTTGTVAMTARVRMDAR
jgi:hypothetical protein